MCRDRGEPSQPLFDARARQKRPFTNDRGGHLVYRNLLKMVPSCVIPKTGERFTQPGDHSLDEPCI